jgi:hypothetical protein
MKDVGKFYGHLVYFTAFCIFYNHLVYFMVILVKSGNPASYPIVFNYMNVLAFSSNKILLFG